MTGETNSIIQRLSRVLTELRHDIRESTDANLLALLRFVGLLYGPLDRRARIDQAFRRAQGYRLAAHVGWRHALGGMIYFVLMVLVATGVLMALYYRPSVQEAYPSVQHIVSTVPFGWLVRDLHLWGANLVVLLVALHMLRTFVEGAYKAPRETNWTVGLLLAIVVLGFGASGYLLPWEQSGYWTVSEALATVERLPVVGGFMAELFRGDAVVSGATLSRFFAVHVILLPWLLLGLVSLHFGIVRKLGVAPLAYGKGAGREVPFYPHHLMRIVGTVAVTLAALISLVVLFPRDFGPPADPGTPPATLPATWVAVLPWRGLAFYLGALGPALLLLLGLALLLLPLLDGGAERDLRRRPVALAVAVIGVSGLVLASGAGYLVRGKAPARTQPVIEAPATPFGGAEQPVPPMAPDTAQGEGQ